MSGYVLLHSPLVGPLTWRGVADELAGRGHDVWLPALRDAFTAGPPYYPALAAAVAAQVDPGAGGATLVAHSGAGALVPAVVQALRRPVTAAVFVDALLPHGGRGWLDTAPDELADQLRGLVVDGVLPPWHTWFPPETLAALLPDEAQRAAFTAEVPSVPFGYLTEIAPDVPGWPPPTCCYLRLSDAYDDAAATAGRMGWRVRSEAMDHLATLTRPAAVADLVIDAVGTTSR